MMARNKSSTLIKRKQGGSSDTRRNPPKSPFEKGGQYRSPPFLKGGLGRIILKLLSKVDNVPLTSYLGYETMFSEGKNAKNSRRI
jgi:hypothetical protein